MKVWMKDAKLGERIGGKHKRDDSSPARPRNALTVHTTMEHGIAPQDNNHNLLMGQVSIKIIHHLRLIPLNNICNKVHPQ